MTVKREVTKSISKIQQAIAAASKAKRKKHDIDKVTIESRLVDLEKQMQEAAENFEFEKAIELREEWFELKKHL